MRRIEFEDLFTNRLCAANIPIPELLTSTGYQRDYCLLSWTRIYNEMLVFHDETARGSPFRVFLFYSLICFSFLHFQDRHIRVFNPKVNLFRLPCEGIEF